jgi:hypothetical protein
LGLSLPGAVVVGYRTCWSGLDLQSLPASDVEIAGPDADERPPEYGAIMQSTGRKYNRAVPTEVADRAYRSFVPAGRVFADERLAPAKTSATTISAAVTTATPIVQRRRRNRRASGKRTSVSRSSAATVLCWLSLNGLLGREPPPLLSLADGPDKPVVGRGLRASCSCLVGLMVLY